MVKLTNDEVIVCTTHSCKQKVALNLQLHQFVPIFECQQEGITLEWNHDRSPTHFLIEHFDHLEVKILHTVTKSCL